MSDFLEQVVAERRADVAGAKRLRPEGELLRDLRHNAWTRTHGLQPGARLTMGRWRDAFTNALAHRNAKGQIAVIAEIKRTSPATGVLASPSLAIADQALGYAAAGATAISVLTEPRHWGGSLADLAAVREAVDMPLLCKDVIVDEYQIAQARAAGADAVLLIAEALSDEELRRFIGRATELSMGALVEAHEPLAFGRAVASGAEVVGVNARDLRRPATIDIGRVRQLHSFVREHQLLVAESGIASVDDARLLPARVNAVLVGTALMRAIDPAPLIRGISAIRRGSPVHRIVVRP